MGLNGISRTVQDIITSVKRTFGDESGVQITDADIIRWINQGQMEIAQIAKINRKRALTDVIRNQSKYSFAAMSIIEIESLNFDGKLLPNMPYAEAEAFLFEQDPQGKATGTPRVWYEYAGEITVWPAPDTAIPSGLVILYIAQPADVSAPTETLGVPDRFFSALLTFVLAEAYQLDDDYQNAAYQQERFGAILSGRIDEDKSAQHRLYDTIPEFQEF